MAPNQDILSKLYSEFQDYLNKEGADFGDHTYYNLGKVMHPLNWWNAIGASPHLKELAVRIFRMPASASGGKLLFFRLYIYYYIVSIYLIFIN